MDTFYFAVLGGGAVGKTSLTDRFLFYDFPHECPVTIVESYRKEVTVDGKTFVAAIVDTGGQEEFKALIEQNYIENDGFLLVYSVTSHSSFEEVTPIFEDLTRVRKEAGKSTPIVLCGNKVDLASERQVSTEEGKMLADKIGCPFFETSAKTKLNVDEAFYCLFRSFISQQQNNNSEPETEHKTHKNKCIIC